MFVQQSQGQLPGNAYVEQTFLDTQGVRLDNDPTSNFASIGGSQYVFKNLFYESTADPLMRANVTQNSALRQFSFIQVARARSVVCGAPPAFDRTNITTHSLPLFQ